MLQLPQDAYTAAYRRRLEEAGVPAIAAELARIRAAAVRAGHDPNSTVVLLCFEKLDTLDRQTRQPTWCHRSMFSIWWQEQTGAHVPELGATPTQMAVEADERLF